MLMGDNDNNPYLQQEVMSASPARLRWMLIKRAHELTGLIGQLWSNNQFAPSQQWFLRIREILGELLDGVKDANHPLSKPISDFYIFLLQMTFEVESRRDSSRLILLGELLAIESETWRMVLEKVGTESMATSKSNAVFPHLDSGFAGANSSSFSLEV
jgi:flagellar protein FliS